MSEGERRGVRRLSRLPSLRFFRLRFTGKVVSGLYRVAHLSQGSKQSSGRRSVQHAASFQRAESEWSRLQALRERRLLRLAKRKAAGQDAIQTHDAMFREEEARCGYLGRVTTIDYPDKPAVLSNIWDYWDWADETRPYPRHSGHSGRIESRNQAREWLNFAGSDACTGRMAHNESSREPGCNATKTPHSNGEFRREPTPGKLSATGCKSIPLHTTHLAAAVAWQ